ncbi:MAG: hypothetical protein DRN29_08575, partial [Thermoplasmata archaeon]
DEFHNIYEYNFTDEDVYFNITKTVDGVEYESNWTIYNRTMSQIYTDGGLNTNNISLKFDLTHLPLRIEAIDIYNNTWTDTISCDNCITIYGRAFNASSGQPLSDVHVSFTSKSTGSEYTSDTNSTGNYSLVIFAQEGEYTVNATKSGYVFVPQDVTFYEGGTYIIDIYMIPETGAFLNSSVAGIVGGKPYNQAIEEATVNLWNATFSTSTTTTSTGWYYFEGLMNGTYYMNVTHPQYDASSTETITLDVDEYEIHNFLLNPNLDLTVYVKDSSSYSLLSNATVIVNGVEKITSGGYATFYNLDPGTYEISAEKDGYYPSSMEKVVDDFGEVATIYLTKEEVETETGVGAQYPPRSVEFRTIDIYGMPISDVNITVAGVETSMGAWSWLSTFFGVENYTIIENTTLTGLTDSSGRATFLMFPTIKYRVTFSKPTAGINETMYFYPKEEQYVIVLTPSEKAEISDYVSWNLSVEEVNSSYSSLNLTYTDSLNKTSYLRFFVLNENQTEIYNQTFSYNTSINASYIVQKQAGKTYFWGFNATHDEFGEIRATKVVRFEGLLIDLGLENTAYYNWIALSFLVFLSLLFSAVTTKFGYFTIPAIAMFFWWVGWLSTHITILLTALILGVLLYLGKTEREGGI